MKKLGLSMLLGALSMSSVTAVPQDLVEKLDADAFATRSKAQKELMQWAENAEQGEIKALKKVYENTQSPEVKMRLFDVLDNTTYIAQPNTRGFVGITMNPVFGGVGVQRVEPKTPAQKVDLRVGDVIVEVDKLDLTKKLGDIEEATDFFSAYVKGKNAGQKLLLKVRRGDELIEKTLKLGNFDAFNREFLNQQQLFFPQNPNQLQFRPNIQLQALPGNARQALPNQQLNNLKLQRAAAEDELRKQLKAAIELQGKNMNKEQLEQLKTLEKMLLPKAVEPKK